MENLNKYLTRMNFVFSRYITWNFETNNIKFMHSLQLQYRLVRYNLAHLVIVANIFFETFFEHSSYFLIMLDLSHISHRILRLELIWLNGFGKFFEIKSNGIQECDTVNFSFRTNNQNTSFRLLIMRLNFKRMNDSIPID